MLAALDSDWAVILVVLAIIVFFGSSKLPKLFRSLGSAQAEYKKGLAEAGHPPAEGTASAPGPDQAATPTPLPPVGQAPASQPPAAPQPVPGQVAVPPQAPGQPPAGWVPTPTGWVPALPAGSPPRPAGSQRPPSPSPARARPRRPSSRGAARRLVELGLGPAEGPRPQLVPIGSRSLVSAT
ncbi:twin-arginine translocase TatA/TatE family subunit [Aciditerrimonas ferrireducens]|uniref:twin-arginine translocase TatA/TatE family subunit n=1 Tax=Aciditerrimonas ferrireducens TaxID=667306 RepID=UPI0035E3C560